MIDNQKEKSFLKNVKTILDDDIDHMDAGTLSRLKRIRRTAIEKEESNAIGVWHRFRIPVAGLAMVSIMILVMTLCLRGPSGTIATNVLEDVDLITSGENLHFYADLEFYAWLAEEQDNAG